jgi:Golgi apyrase
MRLLPEDQRAAVLDSTCSFIRSNYGFYLPDCAERVRVITGEEEGLFGWIAVNYLMDGFDAHERDKDKGSSTFGFLDMGGASTQIAFEPNAIEQVRHADNLVQVNLRLLDGRDVFHPVFVTTWLGFGTAKSRDRYVDQEVRRYEREVNKDSVSLNRSSLHLGSENLVTLVEDPCLPRDLYLAESRHPGYTLKGVGDFRACVERTVPLLNKDAECRDLPCLFNGVHVPPIDFSVNHFIGISDYWYSTQDVWKMGGVYDFVEFEKKAVEYCSRDWRDIAKEFREGNVWPGVEISRLEMQCFKAAWIVNVLHEGIGIPRLGLDAGGRGDSVDRTEQAITKAGEKGFAEVPPHFQSLDEVGDVSVSWTLGKMVLEVSQSIGRGTESEARPKGVFREWPGPGHIPSWRKSNYGLNLNPLVIVFLVVVAFFLWLFFGKRRSRRRHETAADYVLASMEEAGVSSESGDSVPSTPSRHSRSASSTLLRFVRPFRKLRYRFTVQLRSLFGAKGVSTSPDRPHPLRHAASSPAVISHLKGPPVGLGMTSAHAPIPLHPSTFFVGRAQSATPPPTAPPSRSTTPVRGVPTTTTVTTSSSEAANNGVYLSVPTPPPVNRSTPGESAPAAVSGTSSILSSSLSRTSSGNNLNAALRRKETIKN